MSSFSSDALTAMTRSFPRVSLRQSVSRNGRQRWDHAEIVQSEQIYLWKDNGHQQVHQEWGATGVQAANQTDSQDGELHLRWHIVINRHVSAFCPSVVCRISRGLGCGRVGECCHCSKSGHISFPQLPSHLPVSRASHSSFLSLAARQLYPPAHETVWD